MSFYILTKKKICHFTFRKIEIEDKKKERYLMGVVNELDYSIIP